MEENLYTEETISMRTLALELRDEQRSSDAEYQQLVENEKKRNKSDVKPTKSDIKKLDKLQGKYDDDNYYRNILRYAENTFQLSKEFTKDKNKEYAIPKDEKWLIKMLLKEYMSPFLKTMRSKALSQTTFEQFNLFISRVEDEIRNEYKDEKDQRLELQLLNFYTGYERRRQLYKIKEQVEMTISGDWKLLNELNSPELKIRLLDGYYSAIEDFSQKWREEIEIHIDSENAVINEMMEKDMVRIDLYDKDEQEHINEFLKADFQDVQILCNEELSSSITKRLPKDKQDKIDGMLYKWGKVIRAERE